MYTKKWTPDDVLYGKGISNLIFMKTRVDLVEIQSIRLT